MSYYLVQGIEEDVVREYLYRAPSPGKAVRAVGDDYPTLDIRKVRKVRRGVVVDHQLRRGQALCHHVKVQEQKRLDIHPDHSELVAQLGRQDDEVLLVVDGRGYVESWYPIAVVEAEGTYYGRHPSFDLEPDEDDDFAVDWDEDPETWELEDDSDAYAFAHEEWDEEEGWT